MYFFLSTNENDKKNSETPKIFNIYKIFSYDLLLFLKQERGSKFNQ